MDIRADINTPRWGGVSRFRAYRKRRKTASAARVSLRHPCIIVLVKTERRMNVRVKLTRIWHGLFRRRSPAGSPGGRDDGRVTMHYHGTPLSPVTALYELAGRHFCVSHDH